VKIRLTDHEKMKYYTKFLLTDTILSRLLVMQLINNILALPFVSNFVT